MIALLNRRPRSGHEMEQEHDKKKAAESLARVQGQGGDCGLERGQDVGGTGAAVRCASEPDYGLEDSIAGTLGDGLRGEAGPGQRAGHPDDAGQNWATDAGE